MTMPIASTPSPGVTGAGSSSDGTSSTTAAEDGTASLLDPSTFLSLLVDELKYQNPLDPTSSSDFMSQIAELSQVEQLQAVSSSSQIGEASGLIGKTITATSDGSELTGIVTGVTNSTSGPLLDVGGTSVGLTDVEQITDTAASG
ncbi:MAG: flagellar hook capping FlgD N-terminal domain-containing protein [Acidimicrobiales bacterium]|jgi:flagellar basal-body rod modification protein FlgD